jgi:salicylate hydroxylase
LRHLRIVAAIDSLWLAGTIRCMNTNSLVVAGGGIAGLASAYAAGKRRLRVTLLEQAPAFGEVGAGIQLGPNATRRLKKWGVLNLKTLQPSEPEALQIRSATDGRDLGSLRLRGRVKTHYGAPYYTVHRADLHQVLLDAVQACEDIDIRTGATVRNCEVTGSVAWRDGFGDYLERFDAIVNAQGIWSQIRTEALGGVAPTWTGHVAYRALVPAAALPEKFRQPNVGVWLGPDLHVVHYPVRDSSLFNMVLLVEAPSRAPTQDWSLSCDRAEVDHWVARMHGSLRELFDAVNAAGADWRLWALAGRAHVSSFQELYDDHLLHVGDAAHPMLPYLAQGAAMAIEDADALGAMLTRYPHAVKFALRETARMRWERLRQVQDRAKRNAMIFHASGLVAAGRDWAMAMGKEATIDMPWLYNY